MQPQRLEGVRRGQPDRLGHQAAPGQGGHAVVAEVGALVEGVGHDLHQVHHAHDPARSRFPGDQPDVGAGQRAAEPGVEAGLVREGGRPGTVMLAALPVASDQLDSVGAGGGR